MNRNNFIKLKTDLARIVLDLQEQLETQKPPTISDVIENKLTNILRDIQTDRSYKKVR